MEFKGHVLRQQVTSAFRVTESVFGGNQEVPTHQHRSAYVSFLLAGAYVERTRTAERECSMGTVVWHFAGETHSDYFTKHGGHLLNLEFRDDWLRNTRSIIEIADEPRAACGGPLFSLGLDLYHFVNTGRKVPEDIATELLGFYTRFSDGPRKPEWLARVLQLIYDTYGENLTLATAAKIAGVHPVHISRSFRRLIGCTFLQYVRQVRIRRSFDLLRGSATPLVDVALECGFADHAHMSRSIKRSIGITPSAYRARL